MNLTDTSAVSGTLSRRPRRMLSDFVIAFFVFNLVVCALMPKQVDAKSHASADNDYGLSDTMRAPQHGVGAFALASVTRSADQGRFSQFFSGDVDASGRPLSAPTGILFLSLVFAALTALNLQLVRHLREAYAHPARGRRRG
jgi:hypothetical protein